MTSKMTRSSSCLVTQPNLHTDCCRVDELARDPEAQSRMSRWQMRSLREDLIDPRYIGVGSARKRRADLIEACSLSENRLRGSSASDLERRHGPRGRAHVRESHADDRVARRRVWAIENDVSTHRIRPEISKRSSRRRTDSCTVVVSRHSPEHQKDPKQAFRVLPDLAHFPARC